MHRIAVPVVLLLATHAVAQRSLPASACPYVEPRLTATEAAEVAWAAHELPLGAADRNGQIDDLRKALAAWAKDDSPDGRCTRAHLLHALAVRDARLSAEELLAPDDPALRAVSTALLLRLPDHGPVFFAFSQCSPPAPEWEALGGALALRRHVPFAAELFSSWQPCVHIEVRLLRGPKSAATGPGPAAVASNTRMPPLAIGWRRDERGVLAVELESGKAVFSIEPVLTEEDARHARLRWLAYLADEPMPRMLVSVFEVVIHERDVGEYERRVGQARERATAAVERIARAFRERRWMPANRATPTVTVAVTDLRLPAVVVGNPLPTIEGVTVTVAAPPSSPAGPKAGR